MEGWGGACICAECVCKGFLGGGMKDDVFLRNFVCSKEYLKEKLYVVDRAKEVSPECETQCPERYLNWFIEKSTAAYEIESSGFCYTVEIWWDYLQGTKGLVLPLFWHSNNFFFRIKNFQNHFLVMEASNNILLHLSWVMINIWFDPSNVNDY